MAGLRVKRGRAPQGGRRRRGDGRISSGLPQLGRGLHRQPAQPENNGGFETRGSRPARSWNGARRISCPRRMAPHLLTGEGRTRASVAKLSQRMMRRTCRDVFRVNSRPSPTCCGNSCCARRRTWSRALALGAIREAFNALGTAGISSAALLARSSSATCSTYSRCSAGEMLDERFEQRPGESAVRLRRHCRQLRQPLCGGLGLRDAAPCLRRGERQEGRLGPCHRRHGRDHGSHGARRARGHGAEMDDFEAGVREVIVERGPRRPASCSTMANDHPCEISSSSNVNPKLLYTRLVPSGALAPEYLARMQPLAQRLRHLPDECGAKHACPLSPPCPAMGDHLTAGIILAPEPGLHGPRLAGRARPRLEPRARSSRC